MFIDYYRRPNKTNMEHTLFQGFEQIRENPTAKETIIQTTITGLLKEMDGDNDQLGYALRLDRSDVKGKNTHEKTINRLQYLQELYTVLHHDRDETEKNAIITRNHKKLEMLYDIHKITHEGDMEDWLSMMEYDIQEAKISKEDVERFKEQILHPTGDFYKRRETDEKFASIMENVGNYQDNSECNNISDYAHLTWNRVAHGVYNTIKQGDALIDKIIQSMSDTEKQEARDLLRKKRRGSIFVRFSDFDKHIEQKLGENIIE